MGHKEVVELAVLLEDEATEEWQDGVLSADNPADKAM